MGRAWARDGPGRLGDRTLKLLAALLADANRRLPKPALERLRETAVWVEAGSDRVKGACYHPSRRWLQENGFNPEKARSIEIGRPRNFLDWSKHQPAMLLHELAHAYHHQVLGYGHPAVRAAFERARDARLYEKCLCWDGKDKRHYAMTSDQEYFAEMTEAYFSTNDFYPFVRAELRRHDPEMHDLLKRLWHHPPEAKKD